MINRRLQRRRASFPGRRAVVATLAAVALTGSAASALLPNEHVLACLQAPDRACALRSALQTAVNEDLGLEKATVLISVAEALVQTGDNDRALQTLGLALSEIRDARLALVTQEKIRSVAPLMARAGDMAGALALVDEVQIASVRDQVLESLAAVALKKGDLNAAQVALAQVEGKRRLFWRSLELYLSAPVETLAAVDLEPYRIAINAETRTDFKYRGLVTLGLIEQRRGNTDAGAAHLAEADVLYDQVYSAQTLAELASIKLRAFYEAGVEPAVLDAAFESVSMTLSGVGQQRVVSFAKRVGPIEAVTGRLPRALARLEAIDGLTAKADYIARLDLDRPDETYASIIRALADEASGIESIFERDSVLLTLLDGAVAAGDIPLATELVRQIGDDDTQAIGIAKMAPLL